MVKIGKYEIVKADEIQFKLLKDGKFVGYYGYLDGACMKIINLEALEAVGGESKVNDAKEILNVLRSLETMFNNELHYRPKDEPKERK